MPAPDQNYIEPNLNLSDFNQETLESLKYLIDFIKFFSGQVFNDRSPVKLIKQNEKDIECLEKRISTLQTQKNKIRETATALQANRSERYSNALNEAQRIALRKEKRESNEQVNQQIRVIEEEIKTAMTQRMAMKKEVSNLKNSLNEILLFSIKQKGYDKVCEHSQFNIFANLCNAGVFMLRDTPPLLHSRINLFDEDFQNSVDQALEYRNKNKAFAYNENIVNDVAMRQTLIEMSREISAKNLLEDIEQIIFNVEVIQENLKKERTKLQDKISDLSIKDIAFKVDALRHITLLGETIGSTQEKINALKGLKKALHSIDPLSKINSEQILINQRPLNNPALCFKILQDSFFKYNALITDNRPVQRETGLLDFLRKIFRKFFGITVPVPVHHQLAGIFKRSGLFSDTKEIETNRAKALHSLPTIG